MFQNCFTIGYNCKYYIFYCIFYIDESYAMFIKVFLTGSGGAWTVKMGKLRTIFLS